MCYRKHYSSYLLSFRFAQRVRNESAVERKPQLHMLAHEMQNILNNTCATDQNNVPYINDLFTPFTFVIATSKQRLPKVRLRF